MAKTADSGSSEDTRIQKEPRPFLYLEPKEVPRDPAILAEGVAELATLILDQIPALVRALINHTIAMQNRRTLLTGRRQAIPISVLNRRRRSARAWILAVIHGQMDRATLHAVSHVWIPQLAGTGPELRHAARAGRSCMEFLRGAITAHIFEHPEENLVPAAKALQALEIVMGTHLQALSEAVHSEFVTARS